MRMLYLTTAIAAAVMQTVPVAAQTLDDVLRATEQAQTLPPQDKGHGIEDHPGAAPEVRTPPVIAQTRALAEAEAKIFDESLFADAEQGVGNSDEPLILSLEFLALLRWHIARAPDTPLAMDRTIGTERVMGGE